MINQQGTAVYVNDQQFQRSADTDGLRRFFSEMRLERDKAFLDEVKYVFQNGSQNRSYFFADIRYRDYASYERGISYMMPFYGVSGKVSAITSRVSYYTELLTCREEDLAGTGFTDLVFGTDYMRDSEGIAASKEEVVAVIQRNKLPVRHTINDDDIDIVCKIVSKLWEAQESDPSSRFIIRMEKAAERSMDLLQKMYLLLPHGLRLQLGFETNITEKDLKLIQDRGGFPIYILTTEKDEPINAQAYSFPIVIFDLNMSESYKYDANKIKILRSVAREMNDLESVLLDYSEKKVIQTKDKNYSSFRYYEELVTNMNNVDYWWKSKEITSVEQLKNLYDDQKELLNNDTLKKEAVNEFLTKILPQDKLSDQLAEIIIDENYKERKGLLRFLSDELYQKTQINALNKTFEKTLQQNEALIKKKDEEFAGQIDSLNKKYDREIEAEKQKNRHLASENKNYKKEIEKAQQENEKLAKNNRMLNKKLEETEKPDSGNKYRNQVRTLKDSLKKQRIISIAAVVLMVAAIVFSGLMASRSGKLKSQIAEKEQQLQKQTEVAEDANRRATQLEEELNALNQTTEEVQQGEENDQVETDIPNQTQEPETEQVQNGQNRVTNEEGHSNDERINPETGQPVSEEATNGDEQSASEKSPTE